MCRLKTVKKNKSIISLNDQTNIQGPLAWVNSTCIDRNTGRQTMQVCNQETQFHVRKLECTEFVIHRVILYGTYSKLHSEQTTCSD